MKKHLLSISVIACSIVACNISARPTLPPQVDPTPTVPIGITVSFQHVSFIIPEGLAAGANSEVVPAVPDNGQYAPWDIAPEHILFTLNGYITTDDDPDAPRIRVFPAQEYASVNPGGGESVPALQALLADPKASLTVDSIPVVPDYNAAQILTAQSVRLNFQNGSGIRTLAHYGQYPGPITKDSQFYYFQGMTGDGKYYVIATLPITSPLQSTHENPSADGQIYPDPNMGMDPSAFDVYYPAMTGILDGASPDSFSPSLPQIDALIQSITIAP